MNKEILYSIFAVCLFSTLYSIAQTIKIYKRDISSTLINDDNDHDLDLLSYKGKDNKNSNASCPSTHMLLADHIIKGTDSPAKNSIPLCIHVIVQNKCVTSETYHKIIGKLDSSKYSIQFHDRNDVNELLKKERRMFPHMKDATRCFMSVEYEIDLVRLLLLWDNGGILADVGYLMTGGNFFTRDERVITNNDQAFFIKDGKYSFRYEIMGATAEHPILYMMVQKVISHLFQQFENESIFKVAEEDRRNRILYYPISTFYSEASKVVECEVKSRSVGLYNKTVTMGLYNRTVTTFDIDLAGAETFNIVSVNPNNGTGIEIPFLQKDRDKTSLCVKFQQIDHMNYNDLREITQHNHNFTPCPDKLKYMQDKHQSIDAIKPKQRKIPKIVHMTSKSRCLTANYTKNVFQWHFVNHSFALHDDEAVTRLIGRNFPEFPHLQDASKCITSGAGMADLWRYLVLWTYGGIYTDLDNSPGPLLFNGSAIEDEMDAFLEVEVGRFPSQYFIAASPHHPLTFFAVNSAMVRLFEENNIVQQYVPYITGPGALKSAMIQTIGEGKPVNGTHIGMNNRTVTMVGNRESAKKKDFIDRSAVSNHEYPMMDMTHYSIAGRQKDKPRKPCLQVLYEYHVRKS